MSNEQWTTCNSTSTSRLGGGQTAPARHVLDQADDHRGPTGLVGRAESLARVAVEIFVEEHQVAPVRVLGPPGIVAVARAAAVGVGQKEAGQAPGQLVSGL